MAFLAFTPSQRINFRLDIDNSYPQHIPFPPGTVRIYPHDFDRLASRLFFSLDLSEETTLGRVFPFNTRL